MNIPDEAVEAAVKALAVVAWGEWEYVPNELRTRFLRDAKITIEAAAPILMAQAWEEGRQADDFEVSIGFDKNPYRAAFKGDDT